ncbi:MAG TPA: G5 domain-containing protein [Candidatus Scatovivens faecipullorum]|nr:G5 domain-containing protein [Candidatus Scatovivens faecipullorum]
MSKYERDSIKNPDRLPELFKEIQDIRYGRAKPVEEPKKEEIKFNRIYVIDHRFNALGAIIGILFLILFFTSLQGNYIFANSEEEKVAISKFEENDNTIDMMNVISQNISELTKKEIIIKEVEIPFETQYVENDTLPKDEQNVIQPGELGYLEQTLIRTFENDELTSEVVINEFTKTEPVEEIIEVGTSEYLRDKQVHIGDTMFTTQEIYMYENPSEEENTICLIYENIDVKLETEKDGWSKILVDGLEGYVKNEFLTSEAETPGITEKSRIKRIQVGVNPQMPLNKTSGLTKEDFIRIFTDNPSDKNKVFAENAETFYEVEQKYNINGVFLAAIAIHESNWGTSNIATQKHNLFGYGSYDSSAFTSSYTFESYAYGIDLVGQILNKYYLNEAGTPIAENEEAEGTYYNGPTVEGVNVRYASDPNWSNRVYDIMQNLYEKL